MAAACVVVEATARVVGDAEHQPVQPLLDLGRQPGADPLDQSIVPAGHRGTHRAIKPIRGRELDVFAP